MIGKTLARGAIAFAVLAAALLGAGQSDLKAQVTFETEGLRIESKDGSGHDFEVEIARTDQQLRQGLMFRESLEPDGGMLFLYRREAVHAMWMKNTPISLDMLFIDRKGVVKHIVERTVPFSTETITSRRRVKATLELAGGTVRRLGLKVGDKVIHPAFQ